MRYVDIKEAIESDGLRIVIVKAMPSAWGIAAKAMIEFKGLDFLCAHQIPKFTPSLRPSGSAYM